MAALEYDLAKEIDGQAAATEIAAFSSAEHRKMCIRDSRIEDECNV